MTVRITDHTAPAADSAKNTTAGADSLDQPTDQSGRSPMVPTSAAQGGQDRAFIGAYAPRFLDTDTRGRLTVNMAELDTVVSELIADAVANVLRAEATTLHREASECARVADDLTGGEQA